MNNHKRLKQLKQHLKLCKIIILILLAIVLIQVMPKDNDAEILQSDIELSEELRIEAVKLHQLEEYKKNIGE